MTSGYTSGTYTTDSRSGSGHTPGSGSWNNRNTYAPDRGQAQRRPAKNNYTPPHLPGEYHSVSDEESELTPREDKRRSNHHHERNRHHDRQFDASPPRRDSSSYRRPTVHLDTDSDFAMAGSALPERDPSRDRRAFAQPYPEFDITDPRNFTAMDRINMLSGLDRDGSAASSAEREREPFIRREDLKARARRVSFGANEYKTISRNNSQGTTATEEARREREDVERRRERRREERSRQRPGPRDLRETLEREAEKVVLEKVLPRVLPKVLDKVYPRDPRDKAREKKERERDRDREYGYASH